MHNKKNDKNYNISNCDKLLTPECIKNKNTLQITKTENRQAYS